MTVSACWVRLPGGGVRVKETDTHYVDVLPMIYNWRIVTTPKVNENIYDRGWCYSGRESSQAILQAMAWNPEEQAEPDGWVKQAAPPTGRRRPNGDASQEYVYQ